MGMTLVRWGTAEYEVDGLDGLPPGVDVVTAAGPQAPLEEAEVLVVPSKVRVDATIVPRLRRCRLVITTTSGFDHLDLPTLRKAGIQAARLPLARRDAVVQTAMGMILSLTRRLPRFQRAAEADRWERAALSRYGATELGRVAVVGVGVIGARMVEVLRAFGADVVEVDPRLPLAPRLADVLPAVDVLTLHCSLNAENRGMIGAAEVTRMRAGAVLVNTARGRLVDVDAAVAAVRSGHLAGVGLDVFPEEPASLARWAAPDVLVTPHAAGWHPGLGRAIAEGVAAAVRALVEGREIPYAV